MNLFIFLQLDTSFTAILRSVRLRILKFLGSVGEDSKLVLGVPRMDDFLAWDTKKSLLIRLPFQEVIIDLYIGNVYIYRYDLDC